MNRRVELLAPAGNPEGFYGAIHAGADAVYLAGNRFGARAYADNFTTEELISCIRYAHIHGRRVYLTVNTLVKQDEFCELAPYLTPFYEAGLDGVIVQDIGVFSYIREHFPGLELHVSTQMTLTGKYGAQLLKNMGAVRVVPARELSLSEIAILKKETGLEVETFIHGAMCYCYSGQCLFSSILGGRSGNRGRCAQPCRLPYQVEQVGKAGKECYPLSLKDMCTIEHIPELIEAGIDSFKIEGRMKKPEYAAGVTAIYRKYIDKYYSGEPYQVSTKDLDALGKLYIRSERQDGYYYRHNHKDMVTMDSPSYNGTDENLLESVRERFLIHKPKLPICMEAVFVTGEPARLVLRHKNDTSLQIEVTGDTVSEALKQPVSEENVRKQLGKLGDTVFCMDQLQVVLADNAFYPLKAMNDLRRKAILLFEDLLIRRNGLCVSRTAPGIQEKQFGKINKTANGHMHISIRTAGQLDAICSFLEQYPFSNINRIYLDADFIYKALQNSDIQILEQYKLLQDQHCELVIALPFIIRHRDETYLNAILQFYNAHKEFFSGFMVRSMDGLGYVSCHFKDGDMLPAIYTDAGFYIWNSESVNAFLVSSAEKPSLYSHLKGICMPYELKAAEQRRLLAALRIPHEQEFSVEKIVYGRIPLMLTANCIKKTTDTCDRSDTGHISYLIDRYKKKFPVLHNCLHCMNIIYNSLPMSLHGELAKWQDSVDYRLDFTIEDGRQTKQILDYFMSGISNKSFAKETPFGEYTTGHEKRGVE